MLRPCCRQKAQFRLDFSPPIIPFSQSTTAIPFYARNQAMQTPIIPPAAITTSAALGISVLLGNIVTCGPILNFDPYYMN